MAYETLYNTRNAGKERVEHSYIWLVITDNMALQFYIIICGLHASSGVNQNKPLSIREKYAWRLEIPKTFIENLKAI